MITDNTFVFAEIFTNYFAEDILLPIALTCSDFISYLIPKCGFPVIAARNRCIDKLNDILRKYRIIPCEETLEFILTRIGSRPEIFAIESVKTAFLKSKLFWDNTGHNFMLSIMTEEKVLVVDDVYPHHDPEEGNYKLVATHRSSALARIQFTYEMVYQDKKI